MKDSDIQRLADRIRGTLPGFTAQLRMAPRPRPGWYPGEIPEDSREGAGLVVLYPVRGELHVILTVRHGDLPQHAGQVSLPGGAREPDEDLTTAALREGEEEVEEETENSVDALQTVIYIAEGENYPEMKDQIP